MLTYLELLLAVLFTYMFSYVGYWCGRAKWMIMRTREGARYIYGVHPRKTLILSTFGVRLM